MDLQLKTLLLFSLIFCISILYSPPLFSESLTDDPASTGSKKVMSDLADTPATGAENDEISGTTVEAFEAKDPDSPESWVDDYYDKTNDMIHGLLFQADDFLGEEQEEDLPGLKSSRFNLAFDTKTEEKDGFKFSVDLDFRADIKLPRTKERFGLFFNTSAPDELPDEDPDNVQNPLLVGIEFISAFRRIPYLNSVAGVRVNRSPAVFAGIIFRPHFQGENFHIIPQQKVFWFSDDTGLGGVTSLRLDWLPEEILLLRSMSAAKYNEASLGIEWEQTFLVGFSTKGTFKNLDRGHGIKFSIFGHKTGTGVIDKYRIAYIYRRNIFKKWLFMQTGPEVSFYKKDDWDAVPGIRFGLDVLFWTPEDIDNGSDVHATIPTQ